MKMKKSGLTNQRSPQRSAKTPSIMKSGTATPSHNELATNRSPAPQAPKPKATSPTRAKMTIQDASRIYRATATQGNGNVPADSFGARAMRAAMLIEMKHAKPHK